MKNKKKPVRSVVPYSCYLDSALLEKAKKITKLFPRLRMSQILEDALFFLVRSIEQEYGSISAIREHGWKYSFYVENTDEKDKSSDL